MWSARCNRGRNLNSNWNTRAFVCRPEVFALRSLKSRRTSRSVTLNRWQHVPDTGIEGWLTSLASAQPQVLAGDPLKLNLAGKRDARPQASACVRCVRGLRSRKIGTMAALLWCHSCGALPKVFFRKFSERKTIDWWLFRNSWRSERREHWWHICFEISSHKSETGTIPHREATRHFNRKLKTQSAYSCRAFDLRAE